MAIAEIGPTLDLHLGGEDLVFPHHEDEIAQSEGVTGTTFVRQWLHVKHLKVEGKKMSKSLGNFITVRALLDEGVSPAAIRHQLLSAQYRSDLNFTREGLEASGRAVSRLLDFEARLSSHPTSPGAPGSTLPEIAEGAVQAFRDAMDDDLIVSEAMAALFGFLNRGNGVLDQSATLPPDDLEAARQGLLSLDEVFGILEVGRREREVEPEIERWIEERIEARVRARQERDWGMADKIRQELAVKGIVLEDGSGGTRWKRSGAEG
jgi:cysteinyl-tRNA synthetase